MVVAVLLSVVDGGATSIVDSGLEL